MRFLSNLVNRIKQTEDNLNLKEKLINKAWCKVEKQNEVLKQLEFQRSGALLETQFGTVKRKNWELTGAGKIIISDQEQEVVYSVSIEDDNHLTLQFIGGISSREQFIEEKFLINSIKEFLKYEDKKRLEEKDTIIPQISQESPTIRFVDKRIQLNEQIFNESGLLLKEGIEIDENPAKYFFYDNGVLGSWYVRSVHSPDYDSRLFIKTKNISKVEAGDQLLFPVMSFPDKLKFEKTILRGSFGSKYFLSLNAKGVITDVYQDGGLSPAIIGLGIFFVAVLLLIVMALL